MKPVRAPRVRYCSQVEREFNRVAPDLKSLALYGGTPLGPQIHQLRSGVDIIVGTPGRIIDHIEQGHLRLVRAKPVRFVALVQWRGGGLRWRTIVLRAMAL